MAHVNIYGDRDPYDTPAYSAAEAAYMLVLPRATLRAWLLGHDQRTADGRTARARPLINPADRDPLALSFWNVVEASVLKVIRRDHRIPMQAARRALDYVKRKLGIPRPLLHAEFETDGVDLFVQHYGQTLNVNRNGQAVMRQLLLASLKRVERGGPERLPVRLFPWARGPDDPRTVVMDPLVSFGRPVVAGTSIPIDTIVDRYGAGDSIELLAEDFAISTDLVQDATRWGVQARSPLLRAA